MEYLSSRPAARIVAGWLAFLPLGRIATRDAEVASEIARLWSPVHTCPEADEKGRPPQGSAKCGGNGDFGTLRAGHEAGPDRAAGRSPQAILRRFRPTLIALALTGCATTRYVTVPCLTKDQALPAEPERVKSRLTGQADQDLRIVAGSTIRLRAWGSGLQSILEGCREK